MPSPGYTRAYANLLNWCRNAKRGEKLVYVKNAVSCRHVTGDTNAADAAYRLSEVGLIHLVQRRNTDNPQHFDCLAVRTGRNIR